MQSIAAKRSIQGSTKQVWQSGAAAAAASAASAAQTLSDLHIKQRAVAGPDSPRKCVTRQQW